MSNSYMVHQVVSSVYAKACVYTYLQYIYIRIYVYDICVFGGSQFPFCLRSIQFLGTAIETSSPDLMNLYQDQAHQEVPNGNIYCGGWCKSGVSFLYRHMPLHYYM